MRRHENVGEQRWIDLGPMLGNVVRMWYCWWEDGWIAVVEERSVRAHWWVLYRQVEEEWELLGAYRSEGDRVLRTVGRFAEVIDVAVPVFPESAAELVVEEEGGVRYWIVYPRDWFGEGGMIVLVALVEDFVVVL